MNNDNILYDFLDGTLEPEREESLFLQLSSNDEMRGELRQLMAMRDAVRSDTKAFTPPPESTQKLFSALGFTPPPVTTAPQLAPAGKGFVHFMHSLKPSIVPVLLSSAATAVVIMLLLNPFGSSNVNQKKIPVVKSYENTSNNEDYLYKTANHIANQKPEQVKTIVKYVPVIKYIENNNQSNENNQEAVNRVEETSLTPAKTEESQLLAASSPVFYKKVTKISTLSQGIKLFPFEPVTYSPLRQVKPVNEMYGVNLELRGTTSWFDREPSIYPAQLSKLNNTAFTLSYSINDNFDAGFDLRQETFFQSYTDKDSKGNTFRVEQQPNFTSYGASLRYRYGSHSWFNPIGQLTISGTNAGPVGRLMAGAEFSMYPEIGFVIGAEYSNLFFYHQNSYYNAWKISLNYGVAFKF